MYRIPVLIALVAILATFSIGIATGGSSPAHATQSPSVEDSRATITDSIGDSQPISSSATSDITTCLQVTVYRQVQVYAPSPLRDPSITVAGADVHVPITIPVQVRTIAVPVVQWLCTRVLEPIQTAIWNKINSGSVPLGHRPYQGSWDCFTRTGGACGEGAPVRPPSP